MPDTIPDMEITDYLGADAAGLREKRLFLFDMDGTIYRGEELFAGTLDLLDRIHTDGGEYVFITNNSSSSVDDYLKKAARMGIPAARENFFTSTQATAAYLRENHPGAKVYCQGTKSFLRELRDLGIDAVSNVDADVQAVLVGFDTELTSQKLRDTCEMLQRPVPFIATNPDLACPTSFGFVPDCGSICQMLENATGRKPLYIGKPEPAMIEAAMAVHGCVRKETAVIGDRLYTDIAAGLNAGVMAICVLTGEATVREIQDGGIKPTLTFESVRDIYQCLLPERGGQHE